MASFFTRRDTPGEGASNIHQPWSATALNLQVVDRLLEPQTLPHYLDFLLNGDYPTGKKKQEKPYLEADDMQLLLTPPSEWASPVWRNSEMLSMAESIGQCLGSYEDDTALIVVQQPISAIKGRLWEGIAPMSAARWRARGLDRPDNHAAAMQHLSQIVILFQNYLGDDATQDTLRTVYNNVYDRLQAYNEPFNAAKRAINADHETVDFAAVWYEFTADKFASIAQRAHTWVTQHITFLQEQALTAVEAHTPTQTSGTPDTTQWVLTNRLHDLRELSLRADVAIVLPMHGYKGHTEQIAAAEPAFNNEIQKLQNRRQSVRLQAASSLMKLMRNPFMAMLDMFSGLNDPKATATKYRMQGDTQLQIQEKMRGPELSLGPAEWIAHVTQRLDVEYQPASDEPLDHPPKSSRRKWGFIGYRLHYDASDSEWAEFSAHIRAEALSWAKDTPGAEQIQDSFTIDWLDGRALELAENDIAGASKNFKTYVESEEFKAIFEESVSQTADFLVANGDVWRSYQACKTAIKETQSDPGSSTCFVVAVDDDFDPENPGDHADESPDFTGQLRILPSLLISDLFAGLSAQTQGSRELWPTAKRCPDQVYIGPISRRDEERWEGILNNVDVALSG